MKSTILFSILFMMTKKILATKSLSDEGKKEVINEQLLDEEKIRKNLYDMAITIKKMIDLEEDIYYNLNSLGSSEEIEQEKNTVLQRLKLLKEELEVLVNISDVLNKKSEKEGTEEEGTEEEESEKEGTEEGGSEEEGTEEEFFEASSEPFEESNTSENEPPISQVKSNKPEEELKEQEEENIITKTSETEESDEPKRSSTKGVKPENVLETMERKEQKGSEKPQTTTESMEPKESNEPESGKLEGEVPSGTEKQVGKKPQETTGTEESQKSSMPTVEREKPSPKPRNISKDKNDEKQKKDTSGAETTENLVKSPNRMTEFLWLILIISIIGFSASVLWVLLN